VLCLFYIFYIFGKAGLAQIFMAAGQLPLQRLA
jgi:hypothetical protein